MLILLINVCFRLFFLFGFNAECTIGVKYKVQKRRAVKCIH
jgi:hypothetical protein